MPNRFFERASNEPRMEVTEADAFDILCARALMMEPFPNEIKALRKATGWYDRIRMLGEQYGWDVRITITDKPR